MFKFFIFFSENDKKSLVFLKRRMQLRNEIYDVVKLTQVKMILIFDAKHKSPHLESSIYLKLVKVDNVEYYLLKTLFLFIKKIDFFKIKKKINDLIYQLNFSKSIRRMHDVISIIYLEQASLDSFYREILSLASIISKRNKL